MADEWYYAKGGEKTGPVTHAELLALARSGGLARSDVVWSEGMPQWAEAGSVDGLFPATVGPPPLHESGGTSTRPWSDDERSAPNPRRWLGLGGAGCACGLASLFILISIITESGQPVLIALWFLGVAGLVGGVWAWNFLGLPLHGRWVPADGKRGWVEFLSGGTFRREDGTVGTYVLLKNQKFIDLLVSGRVVESWKVLAWGTGTLEVQDSGGEVRGYTKGKTLAERHGGQPPDSPVPPDERDQSPVAPAPAGNRGPGLWHRLRSAVSPKTDECPHCHENLACEKVGEEPIGRHEEPGQMVRRETVQERTGSWTAPIHEREILRQVPAVVVVETYWKLLRCKFCGHAWKAKHRRELGKRPL